MRYGNPSKKPKTIASLKGHSVEFPGRGSVTAERPAPQGALVAEDGIVYVFVPAIIESEVASAGMLPESEIEEKTEPTGPRKPENAEKLKTDVYAAFDILVEGADRESFAGTGVPKPGAVEKILGYPLNNAEVKTFWQSYMLDKKEAGS